MVRDQVKDSLAWEDFINSVGSGTHSSIQCDHFRCPLGLKHIFQQRNKTRQMGKDCTSDTNTFPGEACGGIARC